MKIKKETLRLYAITDRAWLKEGETVAMQVRLAIEGGATIIQMREKHSDFDEKLRLATELKAVCSQYGIPLIINDSVEIARLSGADGVHLGQGDTDISEARKILGEGKIIGATAHNKEEAVKAFEAGADYLGAGAVFPTGTKSDTVPLSFDELKRICSAVEIPVAAIGGINAENITKLEGTGISGAAVVSAVFAQEDIRLAAENLRRLTDKVCREDK